MTKDINDLEPVRELLQYNKERFGDDSGTAIEFFRALLEEHISYQLLLENVIECNSNEEMRNAQEPWAKLSDFLLQIENPNQELFPDWDFTKQIFLVEDRDFALSETHQPSCEWPLGCRGTSGTDYTNKLQVEMGEKGVKNSLLDFFRLEEDHLLPKSRTPFDENIPDYNRGITLCKVHNRFKMDSIACWLMRSSFE